jgi:predicted nucleotidyltransferase
MDASATRFFRLLEILVRRGVEFVVVGGVAGLLEGAPILTLDLDIVHRRTDENIERLLRALEEIHARYRDPAGRTILPDAARLRTNRFNLLVTDLGALDVLGDLGESLAWEDLADRTRDYEMAGIRIRALDLPTLIEVKERANRDKDRAILPILRQTLRLRSGDPGPH